MLRKRYQIIIKLNCNFTSIEKIQDAIFTVVETSILRFDKLIKSSNNEVSVISKNQSAVLTRINALELSQNPSLSNNFVILNK